MRGRYVRLLAKETIVHTFTLSLSCYKVLERFDQGFGFEDEIVNDIAFCFSLKKCGRSFGSTYKMVPGTYTLPYSTLFSDHR